MARPFLMEPPFCLVLQGNEKKHHHLGGSTYKRTHPSATAGRSPLEQLQECGDVWASDLWAKAGVWTPSTKTLQEPGRFKCNWTEQCFAPFVEKYLYCWHVLVSFFFLCAFWFCSFLVWLQKTDSLVAAIPFGLERYTDTILSEMPHALIGVCPPAFGRECQEPFPAQLHPQSFWAPHFYDGVVLVGKIWTPDFGIEEVTDEQKLFGIFPAPSVRPVFGLEQRVTSYKKQLQSKCELARQEIPSILGEIGIPFDIKSASLGGETSDAVNEAADAHMRALEELMLPSCWWNYTPENTSARGDLWNGEDKGTLC